MLEQNPIIGIIIIQRCNFTNNKAVFGSGAVRIHKGGHIIYTGNYFKNNSALYAGGASVIINSLDVLVENDTYIENKIEL